MLLRAIAVTTLLAASASTALAQEAPGELVVQPVAVQPIVVAPSYYVPGPVMDNRWSAGLSFGGMGLSPKDSSTRTNFALSELSLRFRATPHLELELAIAGGTQQNDDGTQGSLQVATGVLGLRYRIMPQRPWNGWLMAGLGSLVTGPIHDTNVSDREVRPIAELGVGIERRFRYWGVHAELRAIGAGAAKAPDPPTAMPAGTAAAQTTMPPASSTSSGLSGGEATIGASLYF
ncbi:MAG TPA: hypothetical protein VLX92_01025 [Kofleriaceae bacterium]|nr:hypothetical protein [Kofleriaceae bacterium]